MILAPGCGGNQTTVTGLERVDMNARRMFAAGALLSLLGTATACGSGEFGPGQSGGSPDFEDVTETNLPANILTGPSMDAAVADLDGDGDLDIIVAQEFAANVLLLNDGTGSFTDGSARLPTEARDSEDVGIADLDGDGDLDVVIVSEDDTVNELYLNTGTGLFTDAKDRLPVTGVSNAVIVEDLTGDGAPDIIIGNNGLNVILVNDGSGSFLDETNTRLPAIADVTQDVELGDVDGDGDLDLLVGNEDDNRLLINDGNGVFVDESDTRIPLRDTAEETREADFGDVDGDGDLDILYANIQFFVPGADPANRLLINDGTGVFADETSSRLPMDGDLTFDADFIDLDGDGDLDIVTANAGGANLNVNVPYRVYLNDGSGRFELESASFLPSSAVGRGFDIEAADLNGDGALDLYLASRGSADILLFGNP